MANVCWSNSLSTPIHRLAESRGVALQCCRQSETKADFFTEDLEVKCEFAVFGPVDKLAPSIWAYSFERNLRPSALAFAKSCVNDPLAEYGQVVTVKAPEILRWNWRADLSRKYAHVTDHTLLPSCPRLQLKEDRGLFSWSKTWCV